MRGLLSGTTVFVSAMVAAAIQVVGIGLFLALLLAALPDNHGFLQPLADIIAPLAKDTMVLHALQVGTVGGIGACMFGLRGIYEHFLRSNATEHGSDYWHAKWMLWYMVRPIEGFLMGAASLMVAYTLLKSMFGFENEHPKYGAFLLAFYAGYQVDEFLGLLTRQGKKLLGDPQPHKSDGSQP